MQMLVRALWMEPHVCNVLGPKNTTLNLLFRLFAVRGGDIWENDGACSCVAQKASKAMLGNHLTRASHGKYLLLHFSNKASTKRFH